MRRLLSAFLRYGLSLLCLIYAFHGVPLAELWALLRRFPLGPMVVAVLVSFVAYAVMGARLVFMRKPCLSFRSAFLASLVGLALNNVLPAKAGEVAKAAWIGRDHGLPFDTALGLIFMERFFDVNLLALLSFWFLWDLGQRNTALVLFLCLGVGWTVLLMFRRRPDWAQLWDRLPLPAQLTGFLTRFTLSLVEQITLRRVLWMAVSTLVLWGFYALQMEVALNGAAGLGLSWEAALGVFALSSLGMLLPSSPGALGIYEAVTVAALMAYHVPRDQALAAAIFTHMTQFIPVTLTGGLAFLAFPSAGGGVQPARELEGF